jgi:hypothetical protein
MWNFLGKEAIFKTPQNAKKSVIVDNDVGAWSKWWREANVHFVQYPIKIRVLANFEG